MPKLSKKKAVDALREAVNRAHTDDLVEIHNELFPEMPTTEQTGGQGLASLRAKIQQHIDNGLEVEEILDLWNVVFPGHRNFWFDEEKKSFHCEKDEEGVRAE